MRAVVAIMVLLLGACARTSTSGQPDSRDWFMESWSNGTFTIQNEGKTYKAVCDGTIVVFGGARTAVSSDGSVSVSKGTNYQAEAPTCGLVIGLVGHHVQPLETALLPAGGKKKNIDGWTVTMARNGDALMLRRWRDKDTYTEETLRITSGQ